MKTRLSFLFAAAIILSSCTMTLNKSIMTELTQEEIQAESAKDTSFVRLYENIDKVRKALVASPEEKAKYAELTYGRLKDFVNVVFSDGYEEFVDLKHRRTYEAQNPSYVHETDSIIAYWQTYKEVNPGLEHVIPESVMCILEMEDCLQGPDADELRECVQPMLDLFRSEVIREFVDPNFVPFDEIFPLVVESEKRILDPLSYEFIYKYFKNTEEFPKE